MLLEAILNNKIKLKKLIASVIQPPNANNRENTAVFVSKIKGEKYLTKKAQAINIRKERAIKHSKKIIYNNKII